MHVYNTAIIRVSRFLREWLLWLLLGTYLMAAFLPATALWGQDLVFGEVHLFGESSRVTLSMVLLALLLFNAGLDIPVSHLVKLVREPGLLLVGILANLAVPILYIIGVSQVLAPYTDENTLALVVLGLALIASMPIAGSSAAWAQTANANLALSLGLILLSTVLSPLTTPVLLRSVSWLVTGEYATGLNSLADSGMSIFMTVFVLMPSVLGVTVRWLIGDKPVSRVMPTVKVATSLIMLLLNYTNASVSLPGIVANPNWGFLSLALLAAMGMCIVAFVAGFVVANVMQADDSQRTALMFGLGLNISSPGLVLASVALAHMPGVMLTAILYTLVQHVVAGVVTTLNRQPTVRPEVAAEPVLVAPKTLPSVVVRGALRPAALAS